MVYPCSVFFFGDRGDFFIRTGDLEREFHGLSCFQPELCGHDNGDAPAEFERFLDHADSVSFHIIFTSQTIDVGIYMYIYAGLWIISPRDIYPSIRR